MDAVGGGCSAEVARVLFVGEGRSRHGGHGILLLQTHRADGRIRGGVARAVARILGNAGGGDDGAAKRTKSRKHVRTAGIGEIGEVLSVLEDEKRQYV